MEINERKIIELKLKLVSVSREIREIKTNIDTLMKLLKAKVEEQKKLVTIIETMTNLKDHLDYTCSDFNSKISQKSYIGSGRCWGCYEKMLNEERLCKKHVVVKKVSEFRIVDFSRDA